HEKGMETFTTGEYNCQPAIDWWEEQQNYWKDVRTAWNEVFTENPKLKLTKKVDDKMLWQRLFEYGDEVAENGDTKGVKQEVKAIIEKYIGA
ncbi:MAG TPA: DUF6607 family protein, partial [Cryomorphaceae bacterium]|nr:DUF6607 family protein [Cryomorphaceae bacterium]